MCAGMCGGREAARAHIRKERLLRKERFAVLRSEYQEVIDEMERSLEVAQIANERYQKVLRLLDANCNPNFQVC